MVTIDNESVIWIPRRRQIKWWAADRVRYETRLKQEDVCLGLAKGWQKSWKHEVEETAVMMIRVCSKMPSRKTQKEMEEK